MREENRSTQGKSSHGRVEKQQTQSTYDTDCRNRTRATLVHRRQVLSPLNQPCHLENKHLENGVYFEIITSSAHPLLLTGQDANGRVEGPLK